MLEDLRHPARPGLGGTHASMKAAVQIASLFFPPWAIPEDDHLPALRSGSPEARLAPGGLGRELGERG